MKKQHLIIMGIGLLAAASCNNAADSGMSDAQVDSIVNARVEEIRVQMMAQNDSMINALAWERADSIIAAMKGGKPAARAKAKPSGNLIKDNSGSTGDLNKAPTNSKENRFNDKGSTTNKEGRFNEGATKTESKEKKEERFNR
jgi:hypothetical protein